MTDSDRIIIVGGGHNGLVCAAYLARGGADVLVLEAAEQVGGAASTHEFAPGFRASGCAQFLYQLQAEIVTDLGLENHGLALSARDLATFSLSRRGEHVRLQGSAIQGNVTGRDKSGMIEFHRRMTRFAGFLQPFLNKPPPLLVKGSREDALTMARFGLNLRRLGRDDMRELLRILGINIYDVLNEHFSNELAKGALALDAVLGTHLGPRSPNSVLTYLLRLCGTYGDRPGAISLPRGGMGSVTAALSGAAQTAGATVRCGAAVTTIEVENGRATGVRLADGEFLPAGAVVSNADPRSTVMNLVGARHFETGFVRRIGNLRMRGNAARLHLALDGLPGFKGLHVDDHGQRLVIAPDMDYVERAFNPAKYGECSSKPVLEMSIPTLHDPDLAPAGKHVLSAVIQYAPYRLKGGWDEDSSARFLQRVIDQITEYAPDIGGRIIASEFLSPADIEARYRIHGGHWHHGEVALDQFLFVRPVIGAPQYALPLDGLYLCGAGTHPGGGVMGSAGRNAARVVLAGRKHHD